MVLTFAVWPWFAVNVVHVSERDCSLTALVVLSNLTNSLVGACNKYGSQWLYLLGQLQQLWNTKRGHLLSNSSSAAMSLCWVSVCILVNAKVISGKMSAVIRLCAKDTRSPSTRTVAFQTTTSPEAIFTTWPQNQQHPINMHVYIYDVAPNFHGIIFSWISRWTPCSWNFFRNKFYGCGIFNMYYQQKFITKVPIFAIWSISRNFCAMKIWSYMVLGKKFLKKLGFK